MALTDTAIRNAKPKDKPYKVADQGYVLLTTLWSCAGLTGYRHAICPDEIAFG